MYEGAEPVSYEGVRPGTPLLSREGHEFGTLEKVLEIASEDLFDGVLVKTEAGSRFVDRDQIAEITTLYIRCEIDDAEVAGLPEPGGTPVYRADPGQDSGRSLGDWLGRTFGHRGWKREGRQP